MPIVSRVNQRALVAQTLKAMDDKLAADPSLASPQDTPFRARVALLLLQPDHMWDADDFMDLVMEYKTLKERG